SDMELENIAGQVTINGSFSGTLGFKNLAKPLHFEGTHGTELSAQAVPGQINMDLGEFTANGMVGPIRLVTRARDIKLEQFTQSVELDTGRGGGAGRRGQRFRTADPETDGRAQRDPEGQGGRWAEHQADGQSRMDLGAQGRHPAERGAARHARRWRSASAYAAEGPQASEGLEG